MRIRIENYEGNKETVMIEEGREVFFLAPGQAKDFFGDKGIKIMVKGGEEPMATKKKAPAKKTAAKKTAKKKPTEKAEKFPQY